MKIYWFIWMKNPIDIECTSWNVSLTSHFNIIRLCFAFVKHLCLSRWFDWAFFSVFRRKMIGLNDGNVVDFNFFRGKKKINNKKSQFDERQNPIWFKIPFRFADQSLYIFFLQFFHAKGVRFEYNIILLSCYVCIVHYYIWYYEIFHNQICW